jgi:hypothetical protein
LLDINSDSWLLTPDFSVRCNEVKSHPYTPPAVLKRIREEYAGIPSDRPHVAAGHDEPPSPIEW